MKEIRNGFRGFREINTVTYDPSVIMPDEMVSALKRSGTYLGTAEQEPKQ